MLALKWKINRSFFLHVLFSRFSTLILWDFSTPCWRCEEEESGGSEQGGKSLPDTGRLETLVFWPRRMVGWVRRPLCGRGSWFLWLSHEREGDCWRSVLKEAEMGRGQDVLFSFNRSDYQTLLRFVSQTAGTLLFQTHRSDAQIMLVNWIWAGSVRMNCLLYVPEAEL